MKYKIGNKSVNEWSNGHDLTVHSSCSLFKDSSKTFLIIVKSQDQSKIGQEKVKWS